MKPCRNPLARRLQARARRLAVRNKTRGMVGLFNLAHELLSRTADREALVGSLDLAGMVPANTEPA